jgi:hypothetical protein
MRYGVNIYPEHGAARASLRTSLRRGLGLGLIGALGLSLLAAQTISGFLLRERAKRLERDLAVMASSLPADPGSAGRAEADPLPRIYLDRVLWHPKLAVIAGTIPDEMFVTEIVGVSKEAGRSRKSLEFTGHISGENPDLAPALKMVESLKRNPVLIEDLPVVEVSTATGTLLLTVEISCREAGERSVR